MREQRGCNSSGSCGSDGGAAAAAAPALERGAASYAPLYKRFEVKQRAYTQQFSHIYTNRLLALRPIVTEAGHRKWGQSGGGLPLRSCAKIIDLRPGGTAQFLVVGCIYKEQVLKPSILDEYSGEGRSEPYTSTSTPLTIWGWKERLHSLTITRTRTRRRSSGTCA